MIFSEKVFAIAIFAFVFSVILIFVATKWFPRCGLLDRPQKYGLTRPPIPYYGGLALYAAFVFSVLFFLPIDPALSGVLIALTLLTGVSFFDDLFSLHPFLRLTTQVLAGGILVYSGIGIHSITNPFGPPFVLDQYRFSLGGEEVFLISALFTIAWVVLMVNSMNFLDGVPGLVSGVTFLATVVIFLLSIRPGHTVDQTTVTLLSAILGACVLAFFVFDFPPPKILMGDTGSIMLGFLIAVLAIFSGGKIATAFLVIGFPLLDALFTVLRRIFQGQVPWKGDFGHLHHRFLKAGFTQRHVVLIVCLVSALFGGVALFFGSEQKFFALLALLMLMGFTLWGLWWTGRNRGR